MLKSLIWKLPIIAIVIFAVIFEIKSYTNTKGSIGELFLYPNTDKSLVVSITLVGLAGLVLIFAKNLRLIKASVILILLTVFLFYPIMDMEGIDNPF